MEGSKGHIVQTVKSRLLSLVGVGNLVEPRHILSSGFSLESCVSSFDPIINWYVVVNSFKLHRKQ